MQGCLLYTSRILEFPNPREEYMEITGELRRRLDAGDDLKDTAILLRTNQEAEGLVGALMERQVPFSMKETLPNLFHHWICRNMMAYMRLAAGQNCRKNFLEIMNRPNRYLSRGSLPSLYVGGYGTAVYRRGIERKEREPDACLLYTSSRLGRRGVPISTVLL